MYLSNIFCMAMAAVLLSTGSAFAENNPTDSYPTYQDGILTIPRVDTLDQAGNFLDGTFKHIEQNTWELQGFKTANKYPLQKAPIEQVKLVITDSFPVQVFLNVQGTFFSGCGNLGQINQRLIDKRFEVTIHAEFPDLPLGTYACTQVVRSFEKNIPLSVYDLSAGSYEYSINGGDYVGTFTLTKDNRFATGGCAVTGCSGQLCVDASDGEVITTCEYREEYACYTTASCERQSSGQCGWTETPGLAQCLLEKRGSGGIEMVQ